MSNDNLRIELYGDIRINFNEKDITQLLSKKSIGIIAYLLCTPSQQASKNTLKDMFWIDAGEKAAYNLRFNLWNIRKHIPPVDGQEFLLTTGGVCRINSQYPLDVNGLEKLEKFEDMTGTALAEELNQISQSGNRLIFMEHFYLSDCDDFNDWLMLERSNRERRIIAALSALEEHLEAKEDLRNSLIILEKIMFLSPFEDEFHIKTMQIHAKMGNYGDAVKEYKNYCAWLKKELGVSPSKKMRESYMAIAHQEQADSEAFLHIKDKVYNSDFAAVAEMLKDIFPDLEEGITVKIDNWDDLDQKSKELLKTLAGRKIITIGR